MDYSKYYTPIDIAERLINEIQLVSPRSVVDICCGSCNLLAAAKNRWHRAKCVGVDINPVNNHIVDCIYQEDGRAFAVRQNERFDLVVANPPFGYMAENTSFPELYANDFENIKTSRLEIEMLFANLRLLGPNGVLLTILPSSFVEAELYLKIRKIIASQYHIDSIIKLDERTFGNSLIKCYAIVLRNSISNRRTMKKDYSSRCDPNNASSFIRKKDLLAGTWTTNSCSFNLKQWDIKRGNISSSDFTKKGQCVLHTSKPTVDWRPGIRYISEQVTPSVYAEQNDIIVSRIGKSAGQWCVYVGEKLPISDCLFRIKDPNGSIARRICGKKYDRGTKGVTTQYITFSDFVEWVEECH